MYYIAKDPVLQTKLQQEADAAFKSDAGTYFFLFFLSFDILSDNV